MNSQVHLTEVKVLHNHRMVELLFSMQHNKSLLKCILYDPEYGKKIKGIVGKV